MKRKTVFIALQTNETISKLLRIISKWPNLMVVDTCLEGNEAVEKLQNHNKIDFLITDLILPGKDGITLLQEIQDRSSAFPDIGVKIVVSSFDNNNIKFLLNNLGVKHIINKPIEELEFNRIIENEMQMEASTEEEFEYKLELDVSRLLREVGIPASLKGYAYLRTAIISTYYNYEFLGQITKLLYPEIAKKYKSSTIKVERAMRHAIEISWSRGNADIIQELFGYSVSNTKSNPSNSEFIARITDYFLLRDRKISSRITID